MPSKRSASAVRTVVLALLPLHLSSCFTLAMWDALPPDAAAKQGRANGAAATAAPSETPQTNEQPWDVWDVTWRVVATPVTLAADMLGLSVSPSVMR